MPDPESILQRLLRAAAAARAETPEADCPLGFDTRVVALWRAQSSSAGTETRYLLRIFTRIGLVAGAVAVLATSGAFWQYRSENELDEPLTNAYAIADNAVDSVTSAP